MPITRLSFLAPGNYAADAPHVGLEETLQLFEHGERLGYDGAWVRQRHLESGVSSAATFLAAATQRTKRIELGSAVIQIGYESPFRLAEDLATVDVLSRGRLNVGLSAGPPQHLELLGPLVFDGDHRDIDFSYERILRLARYLRAEPLGEPIAMPGAQVVPRLQPFADGLVGRLWYGGGSLRSAEWAGRNGFNLLVGNVTSGEETDSFAEAQLSQLRIFRKSLPSGASPRIAVGRVILPTDSADAETRSRYDAYAETRRARTLQANGDRRTLFATDYVGTAAEIVDHLLIDPVVQLADELRLELPYNFSVTDYRQVLTDTIGLILPALQRHTATGPAVLRAGASTDQISTGHPA